MIEFQVLLRKFQNKYKRQHSDFKNAPALRNFFNLDKARLDTKREMFTLEIVGFKIKIFKATAVKNQNP